MAEREILRLVDKYGSDTVVTAFAEVQDYVERLTRQRIAELPDGIWETEDYIDHDPAAGEGLIPIKVKMTIEGDQIHYDLTGSHPAVGSFLNAGFGTHVLGRRRRHQDVLPRRAAELRLLPRRRGRPRPRGHRRQRAVAGRGHRLLLRPLREDHERDLRDLVGDHARARDRLLVQPRVPARRRPRRAPRRAARLHVVRLDGRRLGRAQRQGRLQLRPRRSSASGSRCSRSRARSASARC